MVSSVWCQCLESMKRDTRPAPTEGADPRHRSGFGGDSRSTDSWCQPGTWSVMTANRPISARPDKNAYHRLHCLAASARPSHQSSATQQWGACIENQIAWVHHGNNITVRAWPSGREDAVALVETGKSSLAEANVGTTSHCEKATCCSVMMSEVIGIDARDTCAASVGVTGLRCAIWGSYGPIPTPCCPCPVRPGRPRRPFERGVAMRATFT
jgi:hypothetical protein